MRADQGIRWTKEFTLFLKGLAIFMIVGHNFFHWVEPNTGFNEMGFSEASTESLILHYWAFPSELINTTFDFFGHYGVQVFIFISGVGLASGYGARKTGMGRFLAARIAKIWLSLLLAFAFYLLWLRELDPLVLKDMMPFLFFVQNFIPGKLFALNGPWWFYSLIVQLYVLFPLLYWVIERYRGLGLVALLAVSYLAIYRLQDVFDQHDLVIFATFFGHLPEFVLGIACVATGRIRFTGRYALLAGLVFGVANTNEAFFPFQFIAATYGLIYVMQRLYRLKGPGRLRGCFFTGIERLGGISMAVFAVNGFLRVPHTSIATVHQDSVLSLAIFAVYFIIVLLVAALYMFIFNHILKLARSVSVPGLRPAKTAG